MLFRSARDGVSREVPCSALKGETVPAPESCVWKELSPHRTQCPPRRQDASIPESLYFLRGTLRLRQPHGVENRAQSWELPDLDLGQLTFSFQTVSICAAGLGEGWGCSWIPFPGPGKMGEGGF